MESSSYGVLINKLDRFIRKYYKNQLIKGVILCTSLVLLTWFTVSTLEYYGHFDTGVRTGLFYGFIAIAGFILAKWIFTPLVRLYKLGKNISHEQAAGIIGTHFTDVDDKLINTLQLKKQADATDVNHALVAASLDQRIETLSPIPFNKAIDFKENRKYLKFAIPPFLFFVGLFFINADILSDGTSRILNHGEHFERELPFEFIVVNNDLSVVEQEDFELGVRLKNNVAVPENIYLEVDGKRFKLDKENNLNFSYLFRNVQKNTPFRLVGDDIYSKEYTLATLPNPLILNFDVMLDYPSYTGRQDETLRNSGDMMIPEGTKVVWKFRTKNTEELNLRLSDSTYRLEPQAQDAYQFMHTFTKSKSYSVTTQNAYIRGRDSIEYRVNVVPDTYPSIDVEEKADSMSAKRIYFRGEVQDDYGFRKLAFKYRYTGEKDSFNNNELKTIPININSNTTQEQFFHYWDLTDMNIAPGAEIEYYFEVWDNDGVNGSKATRSQMRTFKAPTLQEISEKTDANSEQIKNSLSESLSEAKSLQQDLNKMQEDMLNKKSLNWQDKQKLEDVLKRQKELEKKIQDLQKKNEQNNEQMKEFNKMDEEILKKQEELQKLMDELMTDEMKKLYEELQKLMDEMNKDKVQQKLDEMKQENNDLSKELDRSLELFKQLEFEQKLEQTIEKLDKLAEEQEKLAEDTKEKKESEEALKERQDKLNEEFEQVQEDLDNLEKKNEELEHPNTMQDTEEKEKEIESEMKESSESLEQKKSKKASDAQKDAAEDMKKLSEQLQSMQSEMQESAAKEDMDALRALLENIVHLSFDQEDLMGDLRKTGTKDPKYVDLGREQKKLNDDAKIIEDSLFALSKRVPQLESTVNREISSINDNMRRAIDHMGERNTGQATNRQQYVMTSLNNLALILDDALQQMQQQMAKSQPGTGQCEKPGGSGKPKPGMGDMKSMQKALSDKIAEMKKAMEEGKKPGGEKPGEQPGEGGMPMPGGKKPGQGPGMSEQLAKMAAQQEALRREMERLGEELNKDGSHAGDGLKKIAKDMEENERDIINRDFDLESLTRQQEIMTRLLEHEKAEREREKDNKRESQEAKNEEFSNPAEFFEYKRKKDQEVELLKTVPPSLRTYYKNKVNQYFNTFE